MEFLHLGMESDSPGPLTHLLAPGTASSLGGINKDSQLADDGESVVREETPGTVEKIIARHELWSSQALGVASSVTEHLLLGHVHQERLLIV